MALLVLLGSIALGADWGRSGMAAPAVLLNEPFTGTSISNPTNWVAAATLNGSATSAFPCLTATTTASSQTLASGVLKGCSASAIDGSGSGALRLTPAQNSAAGYLLYNQALSTRDGLDITFKQAQYGGTNSSIKADGLSFFIKDGSNTSLAAGSSGDGLGYSLSCTLTGSNSLALPGIPGGLFGIGFDRYGNYSIGSASGGSWAGNPNCGGSNRPNYLGIKGPDTSTGKDGTAGFQWLSGSGGAGSGASIDLTTGADSRSGRARNVRVFVDPATATSPKIKVYFWAIGASQPGSPTLEVSQPAAYTGASTFKFGFAASTGGANNIHEVYDLVISAAQDPTYRVTYDANGSTGGSVPVDATAYSGTGAVTVAGNTGSLVKTGFVFGGWNTAANGTGASYAAGSTMTLANADVTLYAVWSTPPAPPPPPAPAPPAPAVEEAGPPAPSPSPSASALPNLDPINNPQNRGVPAGGVPMGQSLYLLNGVPSGVRVVPNAPAAPTGLDVSGDGFFMRIAGRGGDGDPLGLGGQAQLVLQSLQSGARSGAAGSGAAGSGAVCVVGKPLAESSGTGFKAGTQVRLYLLPGTLLGSFAVDGSGAYSGSVPVPAGLPVGGQTLQANGFAPSGSVRSVSLGVQVVPVRPAVSRKASARVFFEPNSPVITVQGRRVLDALAKRAGRSGRQAVVVGFVQQTTSTNNDRSLSTQRARAVAAYLRSKGVKGRYQVRGDGIAGPGNDARRVNISITYRPGC